MALSQFGNLQELDLAYTKVGLPGLVELLQRVSLTKLSLAAVPDLARPQCSLREILPYLGGLQYLSLHGLQSVKDVFVQSLVESCPLLETLNVSATGIKRASMPCFLRLRELRMVNTC